MFIEFHADQRIFNHITSDGEKDSKLNHPDVHQLVANAQTAAEKVLSSRASLLDVNNPNLPTITVGV